MLLESCENVARRCASWGEAGFVSSRPEKSGMGKNLPANLSKGGAYDMVCCAVVGLILPGLVAEWKLLVVSSTSLEGNYTSRFSRRVHI